MFFFLANCWVQCAFGRTFAQSESNLHVSSINGYFFSVQMKQAPPGRCSFFSVIAEKKGKLEVNITECRVCPECSGLRSSFWAWPENVSIQLCFTPSHSSATSSAALTD